MKDKAYSSKFIKILCLLLLIISISCENILEVDPPKGHITTETVFQTEETAEAVVKTLYGKLRNDVLLSGGSNGLSVLMGLYADEIDLYSFGNNSLNSFYYHQITSLNQTVEQIWNSCYNLIYMCNLILENLEVSNFTSSYLKDHLKGETLFVRTLINFYLVNLYGNIPYAESANYLSNQKISKTSVKEVFSKMINDLKNAKQFLESSSTNYERIRADKYAVSALLARVYLYNQNWAEAELESSILINSVHFDMENLENEFLKESTSTIFQLKPQRLGYNTTESSTFRLIDRPTLYALNQSFISSFEANDLRKQKWITQASDGSTTWYGPYKYKHNGFTGTSMEYSIVLRLSEQYLIRSEARLNLGMRQDAIDDLNEVRKRAGLELLHLTSTTDIQAYLLQERKFELFTEHGHRWFDLKRLNKSNEILASVKPNWKDGNILLPIPEKDLNLNSNLLPQNSGY